MAAPHTSAGPRPPLVVRRARMAVFALFFTNGALFANVIPRYPEIKDIFGLSDFWYGLTIALFPLGAIISGPAAAWLIRRLNSARVSTMGTVGIGVALAMVGSLAVWRESMGEGAAARYGAPWAQGALAGVAYGLFALTYFLGGMFDSVTDVGQNAHGLRVQKYYGRSIITAFHGAWSLGAVTGGLMGAGAVQLGLPLGWHLLVAAVLFILVGAVAYRFALPGRDDEPLAGAGGATGATEGLDAGAAAADAVRGAETVSGGEGPVERGVRTLNLRPGLIVGLLTLLAVSGGLVEDGGSSWMTLYMRDYLGAVGGVAGLAYVALLASQAVGRFTADRLIDRLGPRRTLLIGGSLITVGASAALAWPCVPLTLAAMVVAGFGSASIVPLAMNAADDIPGLRAGTGLTIITWLQRLAFLLAPPLIGAIVESTTLRAAMFEIPIAGVLVLATCWVLAPRPRGRS